MNLQHPPARPVWPIRDEDFEAVYPRRHLGGGDTDIAKVATLLADNARCEMLLALTDGRAMTAGRLAATARVSAATASSHLKKLTEAGFLKVEAVGRERLYRLSGPRIASLIETLEGFAPTRTINSLSEHNRAKALRAGRACYDHVGGQLGVSIMSSMVSAGHLVVLGGPPALAGAQSGVARPDEVEYGLMASGQNLLDRLGVRGTTADMGVRYCLDWSENGHHLSGVVGRTLFRRFVELHWIELSREGRGLKVRSAGIDGLAQEFGIAIA